MRLGSDVVDSIPSLGTSIYHRSSPRKVCRTRKTQTFVKGKKGPYLHPKNKLRDLENKLGATKGDRWGGVDRGLGTGMWTLRYME